MFEQLDFVYMPSRDAAADVAWFTDVVGARLVFAIEGMGTRVAMVEITAGPPAILLAEHLEGDRPVLVYRVADLEATTQELRGRGWEEGHSLEIPQGPVRSFTGPGGHPIAMYELARPGVWLRSRAVATSDQPLSRSAIRPNFLSSPRKLPS